jgi:hypothetical protein
LHRRASRPTQTLTSQFIPTTMSEAAKTLRHDLKYALFTIQNIDRDAPLESWAAKSIHKDLFATRRGLSCLQLIQEARAQMAENPATKDLEEAAQKLEEWRAKLVVGADVRPLYLLIKEMISRVDGLAV